MKKYHFGKNKYRYIRYRLFSFVIIKIQDTSVIYKIKCFNSSSNDVHINININLLYGVQEDNSRFSFLISDLGFKVKPHSKC